MTVLSNSPSLNSETQIPITYAPGVVGKPVTCPVIGSISNGGEEGIGSKALYPPPHGILEKEDAGKGVGEGSLVEPPFNGVQNE